MIKASQAQLAMLHAVAKTAAGENHQHIRDRAARMFDLTSLTELTMDQARELIELYQALIKPPEPPAPVVMGRGAFGGLPKKVAAKVAAAVAKPATPSAESRVPPRPAPPVAKPRPVHNFDPNLKIVKGGVEEIPW
jgi:hypothetical protein